MFKTRVISVLACVLVATSACGGSEGAPGASQGRSGDAQITAGCTLDPTSTELFVKERYGCTDGTTLYLFTTDEAKKNWRTVADGFGINIVADGDKWIRAKN